MLSLHHHFTASLFSILRFSRGENKISCQILPYLLKPSYHKSNKTILDAVSTSYNNHYLYQYLSRKNTTSLFFVYLVYTDFILVPLCRKLLAYRHTLKSVPGTNQYSAMSVIFLAFNP